MVESAGKTAFISLEEMNLQEIIWMEVFFQELFTRAKQVAKHGDERAAKSCEEDTDDDGTAYERLYRNVPQLFTRTGYSREYVPGVQERPEGTDEDVSEVPGDGPGASGESDGSVSEYEALDTRPENDPEIRDFIQNIRGVSWDAGTDQVQDSETDEADTPPAAERDG